MLSSRIKAKPSADGSNSAKRLKENSLISRKTLLHNSPSSRARTTKIPQLGNLPSEEKPHTLQIQNQILEHHIPGGIKNQPLFSSPNTDRFKNTLHVDVAPESAVLFSTPSHPEGPPPRRLLNAFLSNSASSKVLSSPYSNSATYAEAPKVLALSEWGLPNKVVENYGKNGVVCMFEWQAECLALPGVLSGGNLIYSAPTSAGKTLVAELLALKCVLELRKKAIFVLPFVSIAQEKCIYLQKLLESVGVRVGSFVGNQSPPGGLVAVDIAICTIEKANSLVNRLLEEKQLACLGLVVVDELHMIGDPHRGYLLELLLTKILFACSKGATTATSSHLPGETARATGSTAIQVVGMSATLPNLDVLAQWLGAQLFRTDFRPVPLTEMVKIGPSLYNTQLQKVRDLDRAGSLPGDEDDILLLCRETLVQGHSVLIFCPTKNWCEKLAQAIARAPFLNDDAAAKGREDAAIVVDRPALADICRQLKRTQVGLDPVLGLTIPSGVAFHHAGLTLDEREVVETAFRLSQLRVLTATSTLSSGVNLPARLVIVRTPFFNRSLLDVQVYKQMVGRAGRKGVDTLGESILMCKPSDRSKVAALLQSAPKPVASCLGRRSKEAGQPDGLLAVKRAVLEAVANGAASTIEDIQRYMSCSLLFAELKGVVASSQDGEDGPSGRTRALLLAAVKFLEENEFVCRRDKVAGVQCQEQQGVAGEGMVECYATQLGLATVASALSPDEALVVFAELCKARKNFVLENELHLVYLAISRPEVCRAALDRVTPVYIQDQWPNIDWYRYLCILERLPADMRHVADIVGVLESFLGRAIQGKVSTHTEAQRSLLWVHQRFYTALALHDLVHEMPIPQVAAKYGASKGLLQSLQGAAGTFAGMTTVFCSRLGWKNVELLLSQFQSRLTFGVERELCDLVRVPLVNAFRARALYNAGFHGLASLTAANPSSVELCLRTATPFRRHHGDGRREAGEEGGGMEVKVGVGGGSERLSDIWCARLRRRVTHSEAARMIVEGARDILAQELNIPPSLWNNQQTQHGVVGAGKPMKVLGRGLAFTTRGAPGQRKKMNKSGARRTSLGPVALRSETSLGAAKGSRSPPSRTRRVRSVPVGQEGMDVRPPLTTDHPYAHFVPASRLFSAPSAVPSSPPPPAFAIPSTPPTRHVTSPRAALSSCDRPVTPVPAVVPVVPVPSTMSASTPLPAASAADGCNPAISPVPSFHLPSSLDASLDLSSHALAFLDAACNEVSRDASSPTSTRAKALEPVCIASNSSPIIPSASKLDASPGPYARDVGTPLEHSKHRAFPCERTGVLLEGLTPPRCHDYSLHQPSLQDLSALSTSHCSISGVTVIDVSANSLLFETFVSECMEQGNMSFAMATLSLQQANGIGTVLLGSEPSVNGIPLGLSNEQVVGVAFCWGGNDVYYLPLTLDETECAVPLSARVGAIASIFASAKGRRRLVAYGAKEHLKTLALSCGVFPVGALADPKVASWLLDPDSKEKTIHKMVLHYLPEQPVLTEDSREDKLLSSVATHSADPQMRASAEAVLSFLLMANIDPLLEAEGLTRAFAEVEMPSTLVLAKMELNGMGFSPEQCTLQKSVLQDRLTELEGKAYSLAGRCFSLTSTEDVAQVLFVELKLPSSGTECKQHRSTLGVRGGRRRVQHPSTAKGVLEKLALFHPLPVVILVWRRVSTTMTKVIFPLLKAAVSHASINSFRIHATCQTHTSTGRVALSDPTLQSVPKEYDMAAGADLSARTDPLVEGDEEEHLISESQVRWSSVEAAGNQAPKLISMRSAFVPFPGAVFLAADYSQLELRVLAHLSGDKMLKEFLNGDGDVFRMIAGQWLGVPAVEVSGTQRQHAKQVCYGMIYGIGAKALGDQLGVPEEEAARFMDSFKSKYPAVKGFIARTIQACKEDGHVTTLFGRKRFLPNIRSPIGHARSQAERQAVNSRIQGSAADLAKMAMINVDRRLSEQYGLAGSTLFASSRSLGETPFGAYLVLQMHDELLYEVSCGILENVADIVRHEMENTANLSVKFPVTIKTGISWGSLQDYRT